MDAGRYIARLCSRFHVSVDFGRRLQPLVVKALAAGPEKRGRLLALVERSFEEEARRAERERRREGDDWRALTSVARILHGWNPPDWFDGWEDSPTGPPPS